MERVFKWLVVLSISAVMIFSNVASVPLYADEYIEVPEKYEDISDEYKDSYDEYEKEYTDEYEKEYKDEYEDEYTYDSEEYPHDTENEVDPCDIPVKNVADVPAFSFVLYYAEVSPFADTLVTVNFPGMNDVRVYFRSGWGWTRYPGYFNDYVLITIPDGNVMNNNDAQPYHIRVAVGPVMRDYALLPTDAPYTVDIPTATIVVEGVPTDGPAFFNYVLLADWYSISTNDSAVVFANSAYTLRLLYQGNSTDVINIPIDGLYGGEIRTVDVSYYLHFPAMLCPVKLGKKAHDTPIIQPDYHVNIRSVSIRR